MKVKICDRIKEGMEIRNLKQSELVEKTGIGKSSISTYLSGEYEPKQKNIYRIAEALNVNEAWLMGYDVVMERELNIEKLSKGETQLLNNYNKLNELGKHEAQKRVEELTYINKYIDNEICATVDEDDYLMPVAAHNDNLTEDEKEDARKLFDEFYNECK